VEIHVRLLLAFPLLILAELIVHQRLRPVVAQFLERGLIPDASRAQFDAAIASAMRLRNSITAEVLLIAFVYVVGVGFFWRTQVALDVTSWYGVPADGRLQPSLAGWWLGCVSLPLWQFLLLRYIFGCSSGRASCAGIAHRVEDRAHARTSVAVEGSGAGSELLVGTAVAGPRASSLRLVAVLVFAILGPLLVFSPQLAAAKRRGMLEYGTLAQRQVRELEDEWRGIAPVGEPLAGSVGGSFEAVKAMRASPFGMRTVLQLAVVTLVPVLPLTLTMISLEEFVARLLKIIF
jgi:hypothetical protein